MSVIKTRFPFINKTKPILLCVVVNAALGGTAFAEEAEENAEEKSGLNTVIITAQRRSESLQEVPLSVTAIYGDKLREDNMASIEDVSSQTPGLVFSSFSVGQPEIAIRGIGTKEDGAAASDSTVISIDDVYISARTAQVFDIFDLERVEVLRGPQGTLYGKNSIGGSINFVTSKPSSETQFRLRATIGENGRQDFGGMVSGEMSEDWLGKFSFSKRTYDGHITNVHNGKEMDDKDTLAWRGQLIWNPNESTEVLFTYDGADDDIGDTFRKPVGSAGDSTANDANNPIAVGQAFGIGGADSSPYLSANDEIGFTKREVEGYAFRVNLEQQDFTFTSITSFRESDFDWAEDSEGLPKPSGGDPTLPADNGFRRDVTDSAVEATEQLTQEIRFISSDEQAIEWVLGAFYSLESIDRTETFCIPNCGGNILDVQYPIGTTQWPSNLILNSSVQENESTSWAAYGQASYDLSETVSVTGGLRYSFEEKDVRFQGIIDQGIAPVGVFIQENFDVEATDDWSNVSGRIVVDWKLDEDILTYASVSNGFKSGGFIGSPSTQSRATNSFDEETATNYEFGVKSTLLDGDLRLNASMFYTDYEDLQVTRFAQLADNPTNPFGEFITENAASAEISGFEVEFTWLATEFLEIGGSYAYLDATYKEFNPEIANLAPGGGTLACPENSTAVSNDPADGCIPDFSGNQLRQAPENMFNLYLRHVYEMGETGSITSKISYRYQDDSFYDPDNNDITVIPDYSIVDALLSWKSVDEVWSVTAWIKNLTDEEYRTHIYSQRNAQIAFATFGQPKRFGITVEYNY
jgi:iron complex outermembrane recepter protein